MFLVLWTWLLDKIFQIFAKNITVRLFFFWIILFVLSYNEGQGQNPVFLFCKKCVRYANTRGLVAEQVDATDLKSVAW